MRAVPVPARVPAGSSNVATPAPRRPTPRARSNDGVDTDSSTGQQQSEVQLALAAQAVRFDAMMKVLAEQQREINAIIDLGMAQTKRDDQLMNEWIRLI